MDHNYDTAPVFHDPLLDTEEADGGMAQLDQVLASVQQYQQSLEDTEQDDFSSRNSMFTALYDELHSVDESRYGNNTGYIFGQDCK